MTANPKTYSRKDNAMAACRKAGFKVDECSFEEIGEGKWTWTPSKTEPEALVVMPSDKCILIDAEGGDYGVVAADRATQMAQDLANSEGHPIEVWTYAKGGADAHVQTIAPVPSIQETPETPVLHVPAFMAEAFGFDADHGLIKDGLVVIEPQQTAQDVDVAAPIVFPPGHGVNAKGEFVPFPEVAEGSFKATLEKSWTTEPVKVAKPEPVAVVDEEPTIERTPQLPELPPLPVGDEHRYILCFEGDSFPQSSPEHWALEFARKTKRTVVIRDADSFDVLRIVNPTSKKATQEAAKAAKGPRAPRQGRMAKDKPDGIIAEMIALAVRRDGVTRPELTAKVSSKNQPWTSMLIKAASRWGYTYKTERPGKNTVYYLRPLAAAAE